MHTGCVLDIHQLAPCWVSLGGLLWPFGPLLPLPGGPFGPSGRLLWPLGLHLGRPGGFPEPQKKSAKKAQQLHTRCALFVSFFGVFLGALWAPFVRPLAHFGLWGWSWGALWASLGSPGRSFEALGASRVLFGTWWGAILVVASLLV